MTNNTTAQTNVYIALTLDTSDTTKFQATCGDLRFTDATGNLQNYFIVSGCGTASTSVHVNLQTFPAGVQTIFAYYGNPTAPNGASSSDFATQASNYTIGSIASEEKSPGPVAYWKFDEGTGTVAQDSVKGGIAGATGGTITTVNGYRIHTFTSSGTFTPATNGNVEVLVVAGGGGGGAASNGGGGGGGGVLSAAASAIAGTAYTVTVGSGGTSGTSSSTSGNNSSFGSLLTAIGGGAGGEFFGHGCSGLNGGSGGGACNTGSAGLGTAGQGNRGGTGQPSWGAGGGGAGGAGTNNNGYVPNGVGGAGISSALSGSAVMYGGGGGGGNDNAATSAGGSGGGGIGGSVNSNNCTVGSPNTGGGGGGAGTWSTGGPFTGCAGGSGIVIVRYPVTNDGTLTNMASPATPTSGWQNEEMCVAGKCLAFDGTDDFVNQPTSIPSVQSLSFWVRPATTTQSILQLSSSVSVSASSGTIVATGFTSPTIYVNGKVNSTITANTWSHIEITSNTAFTADAIKFGVIGSTYFNGRIDEPKLFPYVQTKAQVQQDYNAGAANAGANSGTAASFGDSSDKWLSDGLVGYWKMDENSWNGTAGEVKDSSGNGNNGVAVSGVTTGAGKFGSGGNFTANSQVVNIGNNASLNLTNQATFSFWYKPTYASCPARYQDILGRRGTGTNYEIYQNTGTCKLGFYNGGSITSFNYIPAINTWVNVVIISNASESKLYINGDYQEKVALGLGSGAVSDPTKIGAVVSGEYPEAVIDETRIYNRALSPAEIRKLYDWAPGPVAHWKLDDGSGTTVADSSGNNNKGTWNGTGQHWMAGKFGGGAKFNGIDDHIHMSSGQYNNFGFSDFTVSSWIKTTDGGNQSCIASITGGSAGWRFGFSSGGKPYYLLGDTISHYQEGSIGTATVNDGNWHYLSEVFSRSEHVVKAFIDGKYTGSVDTSAITGSVSTSNYLEVGSITGYSNFVNGSVDDVRIYNYARTPEQIMQDMAGVAASSDYQSSKEATAYYKFDEGNGTTANNSGTGDSALNGTLTNMAAPATATSGWTDAGKFGKGLNFDGVDDYVNLTPAGGITRNKTKVTSAYWIKMTALPSSGQTYYPFLETNNNIGYTKFGIYINSSGSVGIIWRDTASGSSFTVESATNAVVAGSWQHIVSVLDTDNDVQYLYVNGQLVKSGAVVSAGIFDDAPAYAAISGKPTGWSTTSSVSGSIDEVKVYSYALSPDDIKIEYDHGASAAMASSGPIVAGGGSATSARAEYCPPGNIEGNCASGQNPSPVGQWNFEEGTGTTAKDTSGNNNNGTLTNGPTWAAGKMGTGVNFDGVNDHVDVVNSISLSDGTWESWIKPTATNYGGSGGYIIEGSGTWWQLYLNASSNLVATFVVAGNNKTATGNTALSAGKWYHVVMTINNTDKYIRIYINGKQDGSYNFSGTFSALVPACIGYMCGAGNSYYQGVIDQVRIYPYARTPAQVAWDYNRGGPVGWWKMDECQGSTIHDSSGNANDGTLTVGASGTQTSAGTCTTASTAWGNGASGKFNSSLNFDGTDNYVKYAGNNTGLSGNFSGTLSAWIYPTNINSSMQTVVGLIANSNTAGADAAILLNLNGAGSVGFHGGFCGQNTAAGVISNNNWYHLVVVKTPGPISSTTKIYINGKETATTNQYGDCTPALNVSKIELGSGWWNSDNGTPFSGRIDDVRIYKYALTKEQIFNVMNGGASLKFGN